MKPDSETNVLLIDDDENDAMLVRFMVNKMPGSGWKLHWAESYEKGIRKLSELEWDLCLVDYQLGQHTGVQIVTESRARGVACPFVLITGAGSRAIDLQAMRAGVTGYLEKGHLSPVELERVIRYAITSRPAPPAAPPAFSRVPLEAAVLIRSAFTSKDPFVVISVMIDRESALRNHLGPPHIDRLVNEMEKQIREQLIEGEDLFRNDDGGLLLVSRKWEMRHARHFLSQLLSDPMALSVDDRDRTVSLLAIARRNVFSPANYIGPAPLLADLHAFFAP